MIRNGNNIPQMQQFWTLPSEVCTILCQEGKEWTVDADKVTVYLPVSDAKAGDLRQIVLEVTVLGDAHTYAPCVFVTETGEIVDYALERGDLSTLRFHATLCEKNGKICAPLYLVAGKGERVRVSAVSAEAPMEDAPLLGGVEWIHMEPQHKQMMGEIFKTTDGRVIVFDGGNVADTDALAEQLLALSDHVDAWFVTHFHCDHVAAIVGALEKYDLKVDNFYYDFRGAENPNFIGDSDNHWIGILEETLEKYRGTKIRNVVVTNRGDCYGFGDVTVTVLNDAWFSEDEDNPGNDSGVIYKVETPGESVLITGDIGWTRGDYYLEDPWFVGEIRTCKLVQMAHHGQNGSTEKFYNTIEDIKVCVYCAGQWLFDVDRHEKGLGSGPWRTLEVRTWMRHRRVPYTYSSIDGRVIIR